MSPSVESEEQKISAYYGESVKEFSVVQQPSAKQPKLAMSCIQSDQNFQSSRFQSENKSSIPLPSKPKPRLEVPVASKSKNLAQNSIYSLIERAKQQGVLSPNLHQKTNNEFKFASRGKRALISVEPTLDPGLLQTPELFTP